MYVSRYHGISPHNYVRLSHYVESVRMVSPRVASLWNQPSMYIFIRELLFVFLNNMTYHVEEIAHNAVHVYL